MNHKLFTRPAVSADPYATHLPVLRALGRQFSIRRVLEFGAGLYSTGEFLNRGSFPHLEQLVSIEEDASWRHRLQHIIDDQRWDCPAVPPMDALLSGAGAFDLIFIDDGLKVSERVLTIRAVTAARLPCVVVIHDFEQMAYQQAAVFDHEHIFTYAVPWTAVLWNGSHRPDLFLLEVSA